MITNKLIAFEIIPNSPNSGYSEIPNHLISKFGAADLRLAGLPIAFRLIERMIADGRISGTLSGLADREFALPAFVPDQFSFSPDSRFLLALHEQLGKSKIIDLSNGRIFSLPEPDCSVFKLSRALWSHDGQYLAVISYDSSDFRRSHILFFGTQPLRFLASIDLSSRFQYHDHDYWLAEADGPIFWAKGCRVTSRGRNENEDVTEDLALSYNPQENNHSMYYGNNIPSKIHSLTPKTAEPPKVFVAFHHESLTLAGRTNKRGESLTYKPADNPPLKIDQAIIDPREELLAVHFTSGLVRIINIAELAENGK